MSASVGVWKSEEKEEVEDAAALRRIEGSGEAMRRDGRAAVRESSGGGEDVITFTIEHGLAKSFGHGRCKVVNPSRVESNRVGPATQIAKFGDREMQAGQDVRLKQSDFAAKMTIYVLSGFTFPYR
jgi:hypothetical protein